MNCAANRARDSIRNSVFAHISRTLCPWVGLDFSVIGLAGPFEAVDGFYGFTLSAQLPS